MEETSPVFLPFLYFSVIVLFLLPRLSPNVEDAVDSDKDDET
jgi:hypothetical protein